MRSYDLSLWQIRAAFVYITDLNYMVMASLVISAILGYRASNKILLFAPLSLFLVSANNYWVGFIGSHYSMLETTVGSLLFAACTGLLFERRAWLALRDQKTHWWRTAARRKLRLPVHIHPNLGESLACTSVDISESGAFVVCGGLANWPLQVGEYVQVKIKLDGCLDVRCSARLVRRTDGAKAQPAGLGLQFFDLSKQQKQALRGIVLDGIAEPSLAA